VSPVFFIDRSLGKNFVASALRAAGAAVEVHDDHFKQNEPDEVWLPEVGRRGWAVVTSDDRIRYRVVEREAATAAGVALFIFTGKRMRGPAIGDALARALPAMLKLLAEERRPFVARVSRIGGVSLLN
jgi:hypothetical protein